MEIQPKVKIQTKEVKQEKQQEKVQIQSKEVNIFTLKLQCKKDITKIKLCKDKSQFLQISKDNPSITTLEYLESDKIDELLILDLLELNPKNFEFLVKDIEKFSGIITESFMMVSFYLIKNILKIQNFYYLLLRLIRVLFQVN